MIKLSVLILYTKNWQEAYFLGIVHRENKAGSGTIFSPNPFHIPNSEVGCLMGLMSSLGMDVASSRYDFSNTSLTWESRGLFSRDLFKKKKKKGQKDEYG